MMDGIELNKEVDINDIDINTLKDIRNVEIDNRLPKEERIKLYIKQIKNPYCYHCGNVIVKISHSEATESFEDRLKAYFLSLIKA